MPLYTFENTETGETWDDMMSIASKEQYLKDNPRSWRVYIDKTVTEEFVVEAYTKDEAEEIARNKSESYSKPDGSEVEDVIVSSSELNRNTYDDDQIEYLEEEVLNA